jgi:hypothetical protein
MLRSAKLSHVCFVAVTFQILTTDNFVLFNNFNKLLVSVELCVIHFKKQ